MITDMFTAAHNLEMTGNVEHWKEYNNQNVNLGEMIRQKLWYIDLVEYLYPCQKWPL